MMKLARPMDMSTAHASLVVGDLARAGSVEREHADKDPRRVVVSLSEKAKPALAQPRDRNADLRSPKRTNPPARLLHRRLYRRAGVAPPPF
jgi:DNA-binding MarR family transcriptional regulator